MISYSISRRFPNWFSVTFITFSVIILAVLTVVQVVVAGYETITSPKPDYNHHEPMWYDRFIPSFAKNHDPECDRATLAAGTPVNTMQRLFDWKISYARSIPDKKNMTNYVDNAIIYGANDLNCSINDVSFVSSIYQSAIDLKANVLCEDHQSDVPIFWYMTTTTTWNALDDKNTSGLAGDPNVGFGAWVDGVNTQIRLAVANLTLDYLGTALVEYNDFFANQTNGTFFPVSVQAIYQTTPCIGNCSTSLPDPHQDIFFEWNSYPTANDNDKNQLNGVGEMQRIPAYNMLNAFVSAVNLDLGNLPADNIFLSQSALNSGIQSASVASGDETGAVTPALGGARALLSGYYTLLPISQPQDFQPAVLQTLYNCQIPNKKSTPALLFAVFAATAATFMSIWSVIVTIGAFVMMRHSPDANFCDGHAAALEQGHRPREKIAMPTVPYHQHSYSSVPTWSPETPYGSPPPPMSPPMNTRPMSAASSVFGTIPKSKHQSAHARLEYR